MERTVKVDVGEGGGLVYMYQYSMYHLEGSGRVLMNEMDEVILESIDMAYVGDKRITGDARRIVITI